MSRPGIIPAAVAGAAASPSGQRMNATHSRRQFLGLSGRLAGAAVASVAFPPAIRKALAIAANNRSGTLRDVEHIVILMQENRSFDHYFGSAARRARLRRSLSDPGARCAWLQSARPSGTSAVTRRPAASRRSSRRSTTTPRRTSRCMRTAEHAAPLSGCAGRLGRRPHGRTGRSYKHNPSMVYYEEDGHPVPVRAGQRVHDLRRLPLLVHRRHQPEPLLPVSPAPTTAAAIRPSPASSTARRSTTAYNALTERHGQAGGYTWTTYAERLQDAGISWQVYQNNETQLLRAQLRCSASRAFRDANAASVPPVSPTRTPRQQALYEHGIRTRDLDLLKADVLAGTLPQVSWICATVVGLASTRRRRARRRAPTTPRRCWTR